MVEKLNKNRTSVSNILNKDLGQNSSNIYTAKRKKRGRFLHNQIRRFYQDALKTGNRSKMSHTTFNNRIREVYNKILEECRNNDQYKAFYRDLRILLKSLMMELFCVSKNYAKTHNWSVIPEKIEKTLFGGYISFEQSEIGEIEGTIIDARIDIYIELKSDNFKIREIKSYPLDDEDPSNPNSIYHRDYKQIAIYGIILEENRSQRCETIELMYFPNKVVSYEFTEETKNQTIDYLKKNTIESLDFCVESKAKEQKKQVEVAEETIESIESDNKDYNSLGTINTFKDKPLKLINGKQNQLEGYLHDKKAEFVKDGDLVAVEKPDGIRIICIVEEIRCHQGNISGETTCFGTEKVFRIKLNPIMELHPEGPREPRPQTIIQGKITKLKEWEFYQFRRIPQNGIAFGDIRELNQDYRYNFDPELFYQGIIIEGTQGTGKTSSIKLMALSTVQKRQSSPAFIIFDAENEFENLPCIPSSDESAEIMKKWGLDPNYATNIEMIQLEENSNSCLTLTTIDPLHLLLFLHELPQVSYTMVRRIIKDIKNLNHDHDFTFPELRDHILAAIENPVYRLNASSRDAIWRSLQSITLDLFDRPNTTPLDIESMLISGKITIINCFDMDDDQQRNIALYLLAVFHNYKLKRANRGLDTSDLGIVFILDEVQRIMPNSLSTTDYQKRIIHFLSEIQHRGRKRSYGVIYATQHPKDIKKEIIDLCNTKIFFQIQGSGCTYLKEFLNPGQREQLKQLPEGFAFILSKGRHDPVIIKFPYIN